MCDFKSVGEGAHIRKIKMEKQCKAAILIFIPLSSTLSRKLRTLSIKINGACWPNEGSMLIKKAKKLPNIHPGEVLLEEFLKPMSISQNALARAIDVPPRRINEIVLKKRAITADTALRLARAFGTSEQFWMGLQTDYALEEARAKCADALSKVRRVAA